MSNYETTIIRQFDNSTILGELLAYSDQWLDLTQFTADFLANVWNISTAQGFGLDIWGRILGQSRYLLVSQTADNDFGFYVSADPSGAQPWKPWTQAPFYNGASSGDVYVALQDTYYRKLLLIKAAANIAQCNVPAINALMRSMFGDRGRCYCGYSLDQPMHIGYHYEFLPTNVERSIIESGIFPVPAGMTPQYIYADAATNFFGFVEANSGANPQFVAPWGQAPFYGPISADALRDADGQPFVLDSSQLG
jgi:hypothetical protein